jgi:Fe-S-cluster containining protein
MSTAPVVLPPLYAAWMDALLPGPIPEEVNSTCSRCAMAREPAETATAHSRLFKPDAKCCTFMPTLYNFLTGAVLADETPEAAAGRATVEQRIDRHVAVTPLGLDMSSTYRLLYQGKKEQFGRSTFFRCPHYLDEQGGLCGVWRHRNSVCSTYFCKLNRGVVGGEFWDRLKQLLGALEEHLARWCILELGIEMDVLRALFPPPRPRNGDSVPDSALDGGSDPEQRLRLWGRRWIGREREFYRECAALVAGLSWEDVTRICGQTVATHARLVEAAYADLVGLELPPTLQLASVNVSHPQQEPQACYLGTYSPMDITKLALPVFQSLPLFDGRRPTADVTAEVAERTGTVFGEGEVRRLMDFGVLVRPRVSPGPEETATTV